MSILLLLVRVIGAISNQLAVQTEDETCPFDGRDRDDEGRSKSKSKSKSKKP